MIGFEFESWDFFPVVILIKKIRYTASAACADQDSADCGSPHLSNSHNHYGSLFWGWCAMAMPRYGRIRLIN